MRCEFCDTLLTTEETRIRYESTNEFANACIHCLDTMDMPYKRPKPFYEEDIIKDLPSEEDDPYQEDYWNER